MPVGGLLICMGHLQDGLFCKWSATNLEADWEPFRVETTVHRHSGSAGQIEWPGHNRGQSGGHLLRGNFRVGSFNGWGTAFGSRKD